MRMSHFNLDFHAAVGIDFASLLLCKACRDTLIRFLNDLPRLFDRKCSLITVTVITDES